MNINLQMDCFEFWCLICMDVILVWTGYIYLKATFFKFFMFY